MEYFREHKNGLIGTVVFHVALLLMLFLLGFFTPLPLPGEEGFLVNFGDSETGLGELEPSPLVESDQPTAPAEEEVPAYVPPPPPPQPAQHAKDARMTQDSTQTAALDAARKNSE